MTAPAPRTRDRRDNRLRDDQEQRCALTVSPDGKMMSTIPLAMRIRISSAPMATLLDIFALMAAKTPLTTSMRSDRDRTCSR